MPKLDSTLLHQITKRGVAEIIVEREFVQLLEEGKPLRLKMGFDPSRPDLHLGHVVGLRKLRQLQELGHQVILIVGDWTAQIGDPSGQPDTRTMLNAEEVMANAETYMRQFFKIVDPQRTQAMYQSEWFGKFTLASVIELTAKFTVNQFLHREDFGKRYEAGQPLAVTELLYPLLQAYDSVAIQADVEFGGTDQKFNLLVGRELQEKMGKRPQQCFLMPLLVGTDGVRKMSKSLGNSIAVQDPPDEMYGKVMSLPDSLLPTYFELLTDMPDTELAEVRLGLEPGGRSAMNLKKRLGRQLVGQFHSAPAAQQAEAEFERVVQRGKEPTEVRKFPVTAQTDGVISGAIGATHFSANTLTLMVTLGLASSRSEARRLFNSGAVDIPGAEQLRPLPGLAGERGQVLVPPGIAGDAGPEGASYSYQIPFGTTIRVGRRFVRVVKG